ncbi:RNA polymerase sigma-70 factor [Adhaeribacter aquaticus]|uniref:RNA polymerase sigma-70 factor n=1 Tax=Adhaeribacter aquaticus TaxID=299567 RepID=UPI000403C57C|nr:RNA polymerase sigma-70 factor [Adhaeribacter aquaticus]
MQQVYNPVLVQEIEALKQGDRQAFGLIYNRFAPKLYSFALKLVREKETAEEIVQEVFLKLWDRKQMLDPEQNLEGYLYRMVRNLIYNQAKHAVYETAYAKYLIGKGNLMENYIEDNVNFNELKELLETTYAALPPKRKEVFCLSRLEGLSNAEIAEKLHTSNSNVENHINKALHLIRAKLKKYSLL